MGVRLYHTHTGRFLQPDPVPGGSATAYDYCNADPVNAFDFAGTWPSLPKWAQATLTVVAKVGEVASYIPGPIGTAAAAISAVSYAATGNYAKAGEMALTAAANLVGCGAVVHAAAHVIIGAVAVAKVAHVAGAVVGVGKIARAAERAQEVRGGVYALVTETGRVVRTGRTKDLVARLAAHHREFPDLVAQVLYRTDSYFAQRGLEQIAHITYRPILNRISPIRDLNPLRRIYFNAARRFLNDL
jgi:hypothetical protein